MKISNNSVDTFIKKVPPNITGILVYGQDYGLVEDRVSSIKQTFLGVDIKNKDSSSNFYYTDIKDKFVSVVESLSSDSLFWQGKKVCCIRECKDGLAKDIKSNLMLLKQVQGSALLILQAEELPTSSSLRKLFEQETNLACIACYVDNERTLQNLIVKKLKDSGFTVVPEALLYLSSNLGNNRAITNSELDKLILYKHNTNKVISLADATAVIDNNALILLDKLHFSLFNLNIISAYKYALKLIEEENPIFVIRALANHTQRIITAKTFIQQGLGVEESINKVRPMVFFPYIPLFKQQLDIWQINSITNIAEYLLQLEAKAKLEANLAAVSLKDFIININKWK